MKLTFLMMCVFCFFPVGKGAGTGSDGDAESGRGAFYQGYFRTKTSDATGLFLQL